MVCELMGELLHFLQVLLGENSLALIFALVYSKDPVINAFTFMSFQKMDFVIGNARWHILEVERLELSVFAKLPLDLIILF
jgi:hypothetical protein